MTCAEFVELVTEHLERGLGPAATRRFTEHRDGCPGCGPYLDQIERTVRWLRGQR